ATPATAQAAVEVRTPQPPMPVIGRDGLQHLAYELHIANFYRSAAALRLQRIEVYADDAATPLARFDGERLQRMLGPVEDADKALAIPGGQRAVVFVWLDLPDGAPVPHTLRHRIEFGDAHAAQASVDGARVTVAQNAPIVLAAPFRDGRWLAYEGPSNAQSHHWGSVVAVNGQVTIPQRYAVDLIGLDGQGHAVRAGVADLHKSKHDDWIGYAAPVLAVADGEVVAARDGEIEHAPLAPQSEPSTLSADALYGNYVILRIAPSVYVHYAHLQRGSVAVASGQQVRRGQPLGKLGQSGSTGGPHLHLHVSDSPAFEGSEGLPFVFERFDFAGAWSVERALAPDSALPATRQTHERQMPLDNDVIDFDSDSASPSAR
ncbi:MAG: M23 family metallopeptidase, partial [Lysobacter sp.]